MIFARSEVYASVPRWPCRQGCLSVLQIRFLSTSSSTLGQERREDGTRRQRNHHLIVSKTTVAMDNTNVSTKELFARVQESYKKYNSQQKLKKHLHPPKRTQPSSTCGKADTGPAQLCGSSDDLEPYSEATAVASANDSHNVDQSSSMQLGNNTRSLPCGFMLRPSHLNKEGKEQSESKRSKRRARESLIAYLHGSSTSKPTKNQPSTTLPNQETSSSHTKGSSTPESVSTTETLRREAVAASLKAAQEKICAKRNTLKPLSWKKPSFHFPSTPILDDGNTQHAEHCAESACSSSSCGQLVGKRKERSGAEETPSITNYQGLETTMSQSLSTWPTLTYQRELSGSSSTYSFVNFHPSYQRQWTKEEIASLVEFADKWITPDM